MKTWLILALLALGPLSAQSLKMFESDGKYGYRDAKGKTVIPAKYSIAQEFNRFGFAAVIEGNAAYYIDQKGQHKLEMLIFDNGPDDFAEGLARFKEKGKIGYFDERGRKVIPAKFDFAFPFEKGRAEVCNGCKPEAHGEHTAIVGGDRMIIDRTGKVVEKKPEALCDYAQKKNACDGKTIQLNAKISTKGLQHPIISMDKESYWDVGGSDWIFVSKKPIECKSEITAVGRLKTRVGPCKNEPTHNQYCGTALYVDSWKCR